jgi:hypothetical protein
MMNQEDVVANLQVLLKDQRSRLAKAMNAAHNRRIGRIMLRCIPR